MKSTFQPNIKQLKKWIAALYSGEYKQGYGCLQPDEGYCCLGVACKVIIPENLQDFDLLGHLVGGTPFGQLHAPKWLQDISTNFGKQTGHTLVQCNDQLNLSFTEIGMLLQLVYIHKMLENED